MIPLFLGAYLAISGTDYKIELTYFRMRQDLG